MVIDRGAQLRRRRHALEFDSDLRFRG
jgi:hypothetical protein